MHIKKLTFFTACLLAMNLLGGCAALLERSYGVVEPYVDRYWDSSAEDTLRAESYQDLVNSLLLLIAEHAEEGVIRCYGEIGEYAEALAARREVRQETMLGSYLLRDVQILFEEGANYSTLTCRMSYREDADEIGSIMTLSDSQSLVDLLRLTVREDREKLTARFAYDTPREDVIAAVESLWQELCRSEMEAEQPPLPEESALLEEPEGTEPAEEPPPEEPSGDEEPPDETGSGGDETPDAAPAEASTGDLEGEPPSEPEEPPEEEIVYPPCPWGIRFYPDQETAEIVEVLLK